MTTTPRWLRPAIATAAIVALGAASVVVGTLFAHPAPSATRSTGEFPVLQPIGYGDTMPGVRASDTEDLVTSPEQGTRSVAVDTDGVPDPGANLEDVVESLADLPDPGAGGWDFPPVGDGGDPCSPADGSDVDGCPDGLHAATFSILSPDNLWGMFRPNPPTAITNPYEIAFCPAAEVGPNAIHYSIVTNAPGTIQFSYWPRGHESEASLVTLESSPAQTEAWEEGLADAEAFEGDWTTLQHCGILDGLEQYVSYDYELTVRDTLGRVFTSSLTGPFSLPDDRTAPEFRVTPLGANAILLSAPHRGGTEVRFNVQVVDRGESADCDDQSDHLPVVGPAGPQTTEVSADYLAEHGYLPQYTKRTTLGVYVPAGSTILACAGVYEDNRPGWEWREAQHRYSVVLQTPDTPRPVITVGAMDIDAEHASVPVSAFATWEGTNGDLRCGLWASGTARTCGGGPHDITRGDVWVTTSAGEGYSPTTWSAMLPLGSIDCHGGCTTPDTAWYSVPVKLQEHPGEQCGSGLVGPCPATIIGTAVLRVDWIGGTHGGSDTWTFSPPTSEDVEHVLDPLPQMDWLVTPTFPAGADPRSAWVQFPLRVDRPVDYTARLLGDCERPGAVFEASGHADRSASVVFQGACPGEEYRIQVELTDADGHTNLFGGPDGNPWPDSWFSLPGYTYDIVAGEHLGLHEGADQMLIRTFRVQVDGQDLETTLPEDRCAMGNDFTTTPSATSEDLHLSESTTVKVSVMLAEATGSTEAGRAYCNAGFDSTTPLYEFTQEVSFDDLRTGVTISAGPDAPYITEVTLIAVPPHP